MTYVKFTNDATFCLQKLGLEYKEFKNKNDLDKLFTKHMDAVTCGRILDEVREIMRVTDWHLFDKTVAEKAGTSEIGLHLQNIVENYESFLL